MDMNDIETLLAAANAKRAELEAAVKQVEAEQAAGRIGLAAYMRAKAAAAAYKALIATSETKITEALAAL